MFVGIYIDSKTGLLADSSGTIKHFKDFSIIDYLVESYGSKHGVCVNLDACAASLFKIIGLTEEEARKLLRNGRLYIAPYSIKYFPGRFLSLDRGFGAMHPFINMYCVKQYESTPLVKDVSPEVAIEFAIRAEEIAKRAASAYENLGLPVKLISPVSAFLSSSKNYLSAPTVEVIPDEAAELAYNCLKGNWLEAFACGYWANAYDYDINGAYGSELRELIDLRQGEWISSQSKPKEAVYGFCEGILTITSDFHPFIIKDKQDISITPIGSWKDCLTLSELEFLERLDGDFEIERGWWWVPQITDSYSKPFKATIDDLYKTRLLSDSKLEKLILRRIMAGLWGKLSEIRNGFLGDMFNPVYAAIVEANCRVRVAEACLDNNIIPLHVAVDGLITDKPLNVKTTKALGGWRLSHQGNCIIVNSTIVAFEGKDKTEELSLSYDWLYNAIKDSPHDNSYELKKYASYTLAKAVNTDYNKLGNIEALTRTVNIANDNKRDWEKEVSNGKEVLFSQYRSEPLDISVISLDMELDSE